MKKKLCEFFFWFGLIALAVWLPGCLRNEDHKQEEPKPPKLKVLIIVCPGPENTMVVKEMMVIPQYEQEQEDDTPEPDQEQ